MESEGAEGVKAFTRSFWERRPIAEAGRQAVIAAFDISL